MVTKILPLVLFASIVGLMLIHPFSQIMGDDVDDLEQQLNSTRQQLESAEKAKKSAQSELSKLEQLKKKYQGSLYALQGNYQSIRNELNNITETINQNETELEQTAEELAKSEDTLNHRKDLLKSTIRLLYISDMPDPLLSIFNPSNAGDLTRILFYNSSVINTAQGQVKDLNQQIKQIADIKNALEEVKNKLDEEQKELTNQQIQLQNQINYTQSQLSVASNKQQSLQQDLIGIDQQISSLSQKQKEILAAKAAAALASTSVGNTEINKSAIEVSPPKDGQVYFSFWTYGYPHRVGMSQYGAFGRAIAGQGVDQIIKAYYQGVDIVDWQGPENITIQTSSGSQEISFENDYLLGIGEMPSCWGEPSRKGLEALKAQAIASRTYAISYTNNGQKPICVDQACQVYVGASKVAGACGQYWKQAVEQTRGKVIVAGGQPITAWYASTSGGFTLSSADVWGSSRSYAIGIADFDGNGKPYEGPDYANSPWYHKAWGNQPWLSKSQAMDMINAALLPESYNTSLSLESNGGFSSQKVIDKLNEHNIKYIHQLKALEILDQNGKPGAGTAQVKTVRAYDEDGSAVEVTGSRFKFVYNLRSPGTNAIWSTRFDIITAAEL